MGMPAPAPSILTFADLLRRHRVAAGLTQEELAARAHLSVDAVSTLERGTRRAPRKDTVALLAEALALAPDDTATFAATARRAPAAALAATPAADAALTGRNAEGPASHAALPSGVVTFLFADIEGSTTLLRQFGDRFADVLAALQAVLRPVWAAHAGCELGLQDDHVFVVFARADDALAAAGAAQRVLATQTWPAGARVRLRMGVHSGQALLTAGRYVGLEVHRAGRIAAAGHGGQVVVSQAWVDQNAKYGHALPDGTRLRDLGMHRLRDLGRRERLYQLTLPDLPAAFPPLRTLDAWPGLRADLSVVALLSVVLLAVVGLLLSLIEPSFPRAIGLGAASLAGLLLATSAVARPARRALVAQWRDARKPFSAVTSVLLSLVIVVTTLFITKPTTFLVPPHLGYDFTYTYHVPTKRGGTVTIGLWYPLQTLAPIDLSGLPSEQYFGLWNGCVVQLPDLTLGQLGGWKADQCTEVPTVANHDESPSGTTTTFHIDPRAVWSDGFPVTADDYLFTFKMLADPDIVGGAPLNNMKLTAVDHQTVRIDWSVPYGDYLNVLASLRPIPLHVYTTGAFAGVYDPATGAYNSTLAKNLLASDVFNVSIRVDSGPFTVQSYVPGRQAVLVRNPHFYSNFFHPPALDRVTFVTENRPAPGPPRRMQRPI